MNVLAADDTGKLPEKAEKRPDWAILGKVTQNMETILFREKFIDWPDTTRLIKTAPRTAKKSETYEVCLALNVSVVL
jgi:supervillin